MDHNDAVAAFFAPRPDGTPVPDAVSSGSPARRLRDAAEPVAMHAVWCATTNERLAAIGLDFLSAYVVGRGLGLGDPSGAVVAATFAWFDPATVIAVWDQGRATVDPARIVAERADATTASLRTVIGQDPTSVADLLAGAVEGADGTGRPLFAGLRARGRPADPVQRLWWACDLAREHRGDSHVAAATAAGIGAVEMNVLTELWLGMPLLSYTATRAWSEEAMAAAVRRLGARGWVVDGALTAEGRATRDRIEAQTDAQEQSIVDRLGGDLEEVCVRLRAWGGACIDAGTFPADILKRAAG